MIQLGLENEHNSWNNLVQWQLAFVLMAQLSISSRLTNINVVYFDCGS